jgi:hypothetical protein
MTKQKEKTVGYESPKSEAEYEARVQDLDDLQSLVRSVFRCFGIKFSGSGMDSRYALLAPNSADWSVKIRVSDHANTTTDLRHNEPDCNFVTGRKYTADEIWESVRKVAMRDLRRS